MQKSAFKKKITQSQMFISALNSQKVCSQNFGLKRGGGGLPQIFFSNFQKWYSLEYRPLSFYEGPYHVGRKTYRRIDRKTYTQMNRQKEIQSEKLRNKWIDIYRYMNRNILCFGQKEA